MTAIEIKNTGDGRPTRKMNKLVLARHLQNHKKMIPTSAQYKEKVEVQASNYHGSQVLASDRPDNMLLGQLTWRRRHPVPLEDRDHLQAVWQALTRQLTKLTTLAPRWRMLLEATTELHAAHGGAW